MVQALYTEHVWITAVFLLTMRVSQTLDLAQELPVGYDPLPSLGIFDSGEASPRFGGFVSSAAFTAASKSTGNFSFALRFVAFLDSLKGLLTLSCLG